MCSNYVSHAIYFIHTRSLGSAHRVENIYAAGQIVSQSDCNSLNSDWTDWAKKLCESWSMRIWTIAQSGNMVAQCLGDCLQYIDIEPLAARDQFPNPPQRDHSDSLAVV